MYLLGRLPLNLPCLNGVLSCIGILSMVHQAHLTLHDQKLDDLQKIHFCSELIYILVFHDDE